MSTEETKTVWTVIKRWRTNSKISDAINYEAFYLPDFNEEPSEETLHHFLQQKYNKIVSIFANIGEDGEYYNGMNFGSEYDGYDKDDLLSDHPDLFQVMTQEEEEQFDQFNPSDLPFKLVLYKHTYTVKPPEWWEIETNEEFIEKHWKYMNSLDQRINKRKISLD